MRISLAGTFVEVLDSTFGRARALAGLFLPGLALEPNIVTFAPLACEVGVFRGVDGDA